MKHYRLLFLIIIAAVLLFANVAISILRADQCAEEGGLVAGFATRSQHCVHPK